MNSSLKALESYEKTIVNQADKDLYNSVVSNVKEYGKLTEELEVALDAKKSNEEIMKITANYVDIGNKITELIEEMTAFI